MQDWLDIDRISKATKYNNISLLDGTNSVVLQIGASADLSTNTISIQNSVLARATVSCIGVDATTSPLGLTLESSPGIPMTGAHGAAMVIRLLWILLI